MTNSFGAIVQLRHYFSSFTFSVLSPCSALILAIVALSWSLNLFNVEIYWFQLIKSCVWSWEFIQWYDKYYQISTILKTFTDEHFGERKKKLNRWKSLRTMLINLWFLFVVNKSCWNSKLSNVQQLHWLLKNRFADTLLFILHFILNLITTENVSLLMFTQFTILLFNSFVVRLVVFSFRGNKLTLINCCWLASSKRRTAKDKEKEKKMRREMLWIEKIRWKIAMWWRQWPDSVESRKRCRWFGPKRIKLLIIWPKPSRNMTHRLN